MLFGFGLAIFAPILSNSEPLYLRLDGKSYFPALQDFFPRKFWTLYPDLPVEGVRHSDILKRRDIRIVWAPIPYSPTEYDLDAIVEAPSQSHWLGTDEDGRDIASRLIYGTRVSLSVGFVAVGIYVLIGVILGALAGYFGGWVDLVIGRLIEVIICFPTFFLILTVIAFVEKTSLFDIMLVIGLTSWTGIARLVRGEFLKQRQMDYVTAARLQGAGHLRSRVRHILPNTLAPIFVSATFGIASSILIESSLSFLGFGVQPPTPSWGDIMLNPAILLILLGGLPYFQGWPFSP